jgi:SAM-dependent methyltransferase
MHHQWNKAAILRRDQIESGKDITFNRVFIPHYRNCIKIENPNSILEVGCGTGHLAAKLLELCPDIEALEPSPGMHTVAQEVLAGSNVTLHNVSVEAYKAHRRFDIVLSHLCAHVIEDVEPFFRACATLLAPGGTFIFSLPHPCFWNEYRNVFQRNKYRYILESFALTSLYITKDPTNPIEGVPFYHRPLSRYIEALNKCGFALKSLDEIFPSKEIQAEYGSRWRFPRYCVLHAVPYRH